jgi:hypothetical protein
MTLFLVQDVKNLGKGCSWEKEIDFAGPSTDDTGYRKWKRRIDSIYNRSRNMVVLLHAHQQWREKLLVPAFHCQITIGFWGEGYTPCIKCILVFPSLIMSISSEWQTNEAPPEARMPCQSLIPVPPTTLSSYFSLILSCCSHLEHRASEKRFVSLQFLNLRQSVGLLGRGSARRKAATYTNTK